MDFKQEKGVNIKSLSLPEIQPFAIRGFDPEDYMTDQLWNFLQETQKNHKDLGAWEGYFFMSGVLNLLYPGREQKVKINDNEWQGVIVNTSRWWNPADTSYGAILLFALGVKLLTPERLQEIVLDWEKAKSYLDSRRNSLAPNLETTQKWIAYSNGIIAAKILFPSQSEEQDPDWSFAVLPQWLKGEKEGNGKLFAAAAAVAKLCDPDILGNVLEKPGVWKRMSNDLDYMGRDFHRFWSFLELGLNMTILAAEDINITGEKAEFKIQKTVKPLLEQIPSLPQVRKF